MLSTDDPTDVDLYAKDCLIEITGPSGYGSYSVGNTKNTFDHCTIRVPDYALIVAEAPGGGVFTGGTTVFAGRNAIMWHSNRGGLTTVDSGCRLHANQAVFMVKSCAPRLRVMDSQFISNNHRVIRHYSPEITVWCADAVKRRKPTRGCRFGKTARGTTGSEVSRVVQGHCVNWGEPACSIILYASCLMRSRIASASGLSSPPCWSYHPLSWY